MIALGVFLSAGFAQADEFTSSSFKVLDPVTAPATGYGTSSSYQLWGSVGEIAIGTSTSAGYEVRSGFLYFPGEVSATPPVVPSFVPPPASASGASSGGIIARFLAFLPTIVNPPVTPTIISPCPNPIPGDFNCDGKVNLQDLSAFLYLTPRPFPNPADLNNDRIVDFKDLSRLFSSWTDRVIAFAPDAKIQERTAENKFEANNLRSRILQKAASVARSLNSSLEEGTRTSRDQTGGIFRNAFYRTVQAVRNGAGAVARFFGRMLSVPLF